MLILFLCLPFLGFLSGSIFGGYITAVNVCRLTFFFTFTTFICSVIIFFKILNTGNIFYCNIFNWIISDNIYTSWSLCVDSITAIMLCVVTSISSLVHLYSIEYMETDPHRSRFMSYLSLFTFFMLVLVTASNYLQMFVGWEGVGVSSYLLINFWYTRLQANKAAIKAMLVNRVGDFGLLIALFSIFYLFNTFDYEVIFSLIPLNLNVFLILGGFQISFLDFICFFLIVGAMGKSAQLGLHTWLPDAMEGPTPVSALIHAATMVTAGVFLIARSSYIFEFSDFNLNFLAAVGISTAFFAATTGLFQNDIKKVIAYSTCSQLGYMVCACGLSSYEISLFHLSNHAFFKALLFLGAGSIIHALGDEQDMRKMGGLQRLLPFSYATAMIGSLALAGFPYLAGFYSKDVILEVSMVKFTLIGNFSWFLGVLVVFCTAFYSTRLFYLVFLAQPNGNKITITKAHEGSWKMTLPLFILSICSIYVGYICKDIFIGVGGDFWGAALFVNPFNYSLSEAEFLASSFKLVPLILTILGILLAYIIYTNYMSKAYTIKLFPTSKKVFIFFNKKWLFDKIYNTLISQLVTKHSLHFFYKNLDRGFLERVGPYSLANSITYFSNNFIKIINGSIIMYMLYMLLALFLIFVCLYFNINIYILFFFIALYIF